MDWDRLDEDTRQEVLRLARLGQVHPDEHVACAAWELATEVSPSRRWLAAATVVLGLAADFALGGTGAGLGGGSDGRSVRQRWHDRRAIRSIYRTYRASDVPARCRERRSAGD